MINKIDMMGERSSGTSLRDALTWVRSCLQALTRTLLILPNPLQLACEQDRPHDRSTSAAGTDRPDSPLISEELVKISGESLLLSSPPRSRRSCRSRQKLFSPSLLNPPNKGGILGFSASSRNQLAEKPKSRPSPPIISDHVNPVKNSPLPGQQCQDIWGRRGLCMTIPVSNPIHSQSPAGRRPR